ncbi:MAG: 50S ribosomal protein L3 [Candidatus Magasanikbacteria bacterium GW2011_GWA2_46_17]|uniref:Large ribosomal subunit protein uL3 n=1 Tax=Candidatus Magasanikbacteria bacterium GW2011_GWA2_46_17 TaxID=1619042 RepID=A0A0G1P3P4_9BACT|nr:MAG: 50S ribosomal protein L3 [Candidatus Magasanikbacteria bacterium GW2011_GWA2_46_17]
MIAIDMKFILGKKLGMTQVFTDNGEAVSVTRVEAGPCRITQVRDDKRNGKKAVQIGFGEMKEKQASKARLGHLRHLDIVRELREFYLNGSGAVERGDQITVDIFSAGDHVTVVGESKGKGFAGVVKRHHFRGGPASHGHKDNLRAPGSIGAGGVQRVFKGMRMAGRMGGDRVTVQNLQVVAVKPETNELLIKGAVPGGRNAILEIYSDGELKVSNHGKKEETAPQVTEEKSQTENKSE